jgi:hypothetical protein
MNERVFAGTTGRAATARRRALLALGGAGLSALVRPSLTTAAKKGNKTCNSRKTCNKEKKQCREAVQESCGTSQGCLDSFLPCCASCKVGEQVRCLVQP